MTHCCSPASHPPAARLAGSHAGQADYTCPMHPEVLQQGPGDCPHCGMALEPLAPNLDDDGESRRLKQRVWLLALLTLPVVIYAMGGHLLGLSWQHPLADWCEALFASLVVVIGGAPFFRRAWRSLRPFSPNMYTLVALGTGVAETYSLLAFLVPGLFPDSFRDAHGMLPLYFEAAAVIVTLVTLGDWLELSARQKTGQQLKSLMALAPASALRLDASGHTEEVRLDALQLGDRLKVLPGARIPQDGQVLSGSSLVDESMLSGEALPVHKQAGDTVTGGTLNQQGSLTIEVSHIGSDSFLSKLLQQVVNARLSRAPIQQLVDRVAAVFVPLVMLAALLTFAGWALAGASLASALLASVAVLIIACPCALGLATPIAVMVTSGRAASEGVLFRDAAAMQSLAEADTLLLDKTGTLTAGKPQLIGCISEQTDNDELLHLACALEAHSEHPLSQPFKQLAHANQWTLPHCDDAESLAGRGISGSIAGQRLLIGNHRLLIEKGVEVSDEQQRRIQQKQQGRSAIYLAIDGHFAAAWLVTDPIKEGAANTIKQLKAAGFNIIMASGDHAESAQLVASQLGIEDVEAGLLPADKLALVKQLQAEGQRVAMVGDGINDAAALAAADVGIAMGQGTDIAIDSAHITLVSSEPAAIRRAWRLARANQKNIRQNLWFAFLYNAIGIPLAAGLFYPAFGLLLTPAFAALAMSLSSVSVITNALRLRKA